MVLRAFEATTAPESFVAPNGSVPRFGPPADALAEVAEAHLARGLEALNTTSLATTERLEAYRTELRRSESLLAASVRARATDPRLVARLAAARWELAPPLDEATAARHLGLVAQAGHMAPTWAEVQRDLGELLWKMGRQDAALVRLRRAAELKPELTAELVALLRRYHVDVASLRRVLPTGPENLVALGELYRDDGREDEYVALLAPHLERATPALLDAWAAARRTLGPPQDLVDALDALGPYDEPLIEARRLLHRAGALETLARRDDAVSDLRSMLDLCRDDADASERAARVALRAGEPDLAVAALHQALGTLAQRGGSDAVRARLYRSLGQAEEQRRRMDRAYDAYRHALELNPVERVARRRIEEMRRAAGATGASKPGPPVPAGL